MLPSDGSVYEDRDPREKGRRLFVERVENGYVYGISRERLTRIRLDRFSKSWRYVGEPTVVNAMREEGK